MPPTPHTALDTRREELLRSQSAQVTTQQRLPSIKIMGAAAGLYEFSDTNDTVREFEAVVLNSHPRNILWDKDYGDEPTPGATEADKQPACVANDGVNGQPRVGFPHLGIAPNLGKKPDNPNLVGALGTELVACATCPYNIFGSKRLITEKGNPRGKANSNYKSVFVLLLDRVIPFELRISATSLGKFDKYLTDLIGANVPVQTVMTRFAQIKQNKNGKQWAEVTLERGRTLTDEEFDVVMRTRTSSMMLITPRAPQAMPDVSISQTEPEATRMSDEPQDDIGF